jgi:Holliday junction resolvasome RuvABC DNA-binding subunit
MTSAASETARVGATDEPASVLDTSGCVSDGSRLDAAILRTQAKAALTGLGWKPAIANAAVSAAAAAQGTAVTLERLIFESLRRCPVPSV